MEPLPINAQPLEADEFFAVHKFHLSSEKVDWHNYEAIGEEKRRVGPGENGVGESLTSAEKEENDKLFKENGYNAVLSDRISVNRSVKDIRHKG